MQDEDERGVNRQNVGNNAPDSEDEHANDDYGPAEEKQPSHVNADDSELELEQELEQEQEQEESEAQH